MMLFMVKEENCVLTDQRLLLEDKFSSCLLSNVSATNRRYSKGDVNTRVGSAALSTFHLQLDLMTFFDYFHGKKFEQAYSVSMI